LYNISAAAHSSSNLSGIYDAKVGLFHASSPDGNDTDAKFTVETSMDCTAYNLVLNYGCSHASELLSLPPSTAGFSVHAHYRQRHRQSHQRHPDIRRPATGNSKLP